MENTVENQWRKCSSCKKPILFGGRYYVCSVSTCNGPRTGYVFCGVSCFETHLPGARHKEAGAIEKMAPRSAAAANETAGDEGRTPNRIIVKPTGAAAASSSSTPQEVLVIASRLKDYIQAKADYNTSAGVMDVLSQYLRILCDRAIDNARAEGRKTVLDRDFDFLKSNK